MEGMSAWTSEELAVIAGAQELEVAARRRDGSLRKAVPIWVVRTGDDLFVRAAYGPGTGWHRAARAAGEGRIRVGGVEKDVTFEPAGDDVNGGVDAAYHAKYGHSRIVDTVVDDAARASTLRLVPRG